MLNATRSTTTHPGHRHRSIPHNPVALPVMPEDLHEQITEAHQAVEQAEQQARQLEARMRRIPGLERLLPRRQFGQPVNIDALKRNLTAVSLLNQDPELASFLGVQSGAFAREAEERAAAQMRAEALRLRTARLREANQQRQLQRERASLAGVNPITNRRLGQ